MERRPRTIEIVNGRRIQKRIWGWMLEYEHIRMIKFPGEPLITWTRFEALKFAREAAIKLGPIQEVDEANMIPKRPRDPNQLAKSIIDIATGQKPDRDPTPEEQGKDPAAVAMGKKGGKARAEGLSAEKRSEIARKAAKTRWSD